MKADYNQINADLRESNWQAILEGKDINEQLDSFTKFKKQVIQKYVPNRRISIELNKQNSHVIKRTEKIQEKHRLRYKAIENKDEAVRQKYKIVKSSKKTNNKDYAAIQKELS